MIAHVGNLEGGAALVTDDVDRGKVHHSLRMYRDLLSGKTAAVGKVWGNASVLDHAVEGRLTTLLLKDGKTLHVLVRRKSVEEGHISIGVDEPMAAF